MAVGYEGELQLSQFEIMGTEYRFQNYHGYIRIQFQFNECASMLLLLFAMLFCHGGILTLWFCAEEGDCINFQNQSRGRPMTICVGQRGVKDELKPDF